MGLHCKLFAIVLTLICSLALSRALLAQENVADTKQAETEAKAADQSPQHDADHKENLDSKPPFRLKDDLQTPASNQGGRSVATLVFGLFAVLAAIFALAWLSKRFNLNLPGTSSNMKLVGALSVGAKEKLILVEVEGSKLLLGVTPQQISLLKNFDSLESQAQQGEFSDKMLKLLKAEADDDL